MEMLWCKHPNGVWPGDEAQLSGICKDAILLFVRQSLLAPVHFVHDKSGVPRRPIVVSMAQALFVFCVSLFRFSQELGELFFSKVHGACNETPISSYVMLFRKRTLEKGVSPKDGADAEFPCVGGWSRPSGLR